MNWRIAVLMFFATGELFAVSYSRGPDEYQGIQYTASGSATASRTDAEHWSYSISGSVTASAPSPHHAPQFKIFVATNSTGGNMVAAVTMAAVKPAGATEGSNSTSGTNVVLSSLYTHWALWIGNDGLTSGFSSWEAFSAPPTKYKCTVTIPANNTENLIRYWFYQGEVIVAEAFSEPGQGPQIKQIVNLDSADPVVMKEVSYISEIAEDPLHPGAYIVVGQQLNEIRIVGSVVPTIGGSTAPPPTPPKPAPPPINRTPPTTPPVPPVPAPTPTPPTPHIPIANPTPKAPPNAAPTGTGGATKEDIERQTNQISESLDNVNTEATKNANGIIGAVNAAATANHTGQNATINAINSASTASATSAAAQIGALNKAQSSLDRINGTLSSLASNTGATTGKLDSIYSAITDGPDVAAASYPGTFNGTLAASTAEPVTSLVSKLPAVPNVLPTSIGSTSHFVFSLKFPPLTQTFTVDVDMAPYATPIGFLRGTMKGGLAILFFFLVVNTLKKAVA